MSDFQNTDIELRPYEVSDDLIRDVLKNEEAVENIDGYQGHPIKGLGDVYTPEPIVEFILDSVGYKPTNEIERYPIVDLSCGTGSFVKAIVSRLKERMELMGYSGEDSQTAQQIISTVRNNVVALDLNKMAILRTAQLVINELSSEIDVCDTVNPVESLRLHNTNSLHPSLPGQLGQFGFAVCNPPYVRNNEIQESDDKFYRENFETAVGKYDLYQLFFEQGVNLLKPEGMLGVVSPDRFHYTDYGKPLRKLVRERTLISLVVNMEDGPFPVVNAYPSITILQKKKDSFLDYQYDNQFPYCEADLEDLSKLSESGVGTENSRFCAEMKQDELKDDKWVFSSPRARGIYQKLQDQLIPFKNSRAEMKTGIATGADDIFILSGADRERIESDLIFPLVRGSHVGKGNIKNEEFILNPYSIDGGPVNLGKYPAAENYLEHHRSKLENRYCVREGGKLWYETHDTIETGEEIKRKIVTPDITSSATFAVVDGRITHNTCYSINHPDDLYVLAGFLSSSVFEFILETNLPRIDSGYWRQMKRDFKDLPILRIGRIPNDTREGLKHAYIENNWNQVDDLVFNYLDLTDSERRIILGDR